MSSPLGSAPEVVVADAGPLISLGRIDLLPLLLRLFHEVQVPEAVITECLVQPQRPDALRLAGALDAGLLTRCRATPISAPGIGPGEREAIGHALQCGATLLADDLAAREFARSAGLRVVGTLGVLVRAKQLGHLTAVGAAIERLRASGQRLSHEAVAQALAAAGESG